MSRSFQSAARHDLTFYHYDIFKSLQVKMGPNQENCPSRKECLSSLIYYFFICKGVLPACTSVCVDVCLVPKMPAEGVGHLRLEKQIVVSCHVGAGN